MTATSTAHAGRTGTTVVLAVDVRTRTEQELVRAWAAEHHPGADVLAAGDAAVAQDIGDPSIVPVRVTWLPPVREGEHSVRPSDFLLMVNPRRPPAPFQPRIARKGSQRVRVIAGAPATVTELRARFDREAAGHGAEAFATFIGRQAQLACDRAERQVIGDRYKVPRLVAEQIAASTRFRERADRLAAELGRPADEVLAEGEDCLRELATVQSPIGIDLYRAFCAPMYRRAWTVEADHVAFERLKELGRKHALVFLPTHRSYVDALVLQEALNANGMPPNHILGGDNMSWWPFGAIGRRAGVVWIRRNFGKDRVYKLAVREFLGHLVSKRFNLEWYIEGGRTRTGKLRPPKLGLLNYLTEALEDDRGEDVLLVPVAIVYDRLREVAMMAAEQTGFVKPKEGLGWFADYVRTQSEHVGKARVHVGEPFLLREALAEVGEGRVRLEKVAFRICDQINRVTPVTASSLVAFALLGSRDRALTLGQIERIAAPLLDYADARGLEGPLGELRRPAELLRGLDSLVDAGVAERYDRGTEPVWSVAREGHHVAAFYRNGAVHHFVNRAIIELALLRAAQEDPGPDGSVSLEISWREALRLRDLLKFEFFFADKDQFRGQLQVEAELFAPGWQERVAGGDAQSLLDDADALLAHRVLRSFLEGQLVVAERLCELHPRTAIDRKDFLEECLDVGGQMLRQGRLYAAEAVGREVFSAALDLARNRDLIDPGGADVAARRQAWLAEVQGVLRDLDQIRDADDRKLREVLDGDAA